jgi:hypothetical protein
MTLTQNLHVMKILHMHEGYGMHTRSFIEIWMHFFDILRNTRYQYQMINFHTKVSYCMFFNHITKLCHGYDMCCRNLKKHSSLFWMLNQQRNAWISFYWQMQFSSCGNVSFFNGRGATSLMDLEMCQHVWQN